MIPAPENPTDASQPFPVFMYDGDCGACNRFVMLLLKLDRRDRIRFVALADAIDILRLHGLEKAVCGTAAFISDWNRRSEISPSVEAAAIADALYSCGGFLTVVALLVRAFPSAVANSLYRAFAQRRLVLGGTSTCAVPRIEWRHRFLHKMDLATVPGSERTAAPSGARP